MSLRKKECVKQQYKRFKYNDEDMKKAIEDVKSGVSLNAAAVTYNVPKSTLHSRVSGKIPEKTKMGPKSVLSEEEEEHLKQWILGKAQVGFPMHPDEVKDAVQRILQVSPRENPFKDNRPGDKWMSLFIRRHPEISTRNTEIISKAGTAVTEQGIKKWFSKAKCFLEKSNNIDVLNHPSNIFYSEENGLLVCGKTGVVLGVKGDKKTSEIASNIAEKEYITVLCTFSATGRMPPPMIIYPYKRIPTQIHVNFPEEWTVGRSDNGLMVHTTFHDYIVKIFHPWCTKNNIEFPVIFFIDSNKYHVNSELHDFCVKHRIILYSLPPNSTGMLRPFDAAVLKPIRNHWRKIIVRGKQSGEKPMTKTTLAAMCKKSFDHLFIDDKEELIKKGFKACGLYPFDENALNYGKCGSLARTLSVDQFLQSSVTIQDFRVTKRVIEYFIGPEKSQIFMNMMNANSTESSVDSLFLCWKMCADQINGLNLETESEDAENHVGQNPLECLEISRFSDDPESMNVSETD